MAKMSSCIRIFSLLCVVMITAASCVPVGDLPTDYKLNLKVDTGQGVLDSIQAAENALTEAEAKAGEEARKTIEDASAQLSGLATEVITLVGTQLDQKIDKLDKMIQLKLVWIEHQVDQLHAYALDIIQATGNEARNTIREAELGMRRTIQQTQDAADKTIAGATTGGIIFVNTVADRILSVGGVAVGILLLFIATFGWGRLIFARRLPAVGLQRTMAAVLMAVSLVVALAPFAMLYPPLRAYALTSAGQGNEADLVFKKLIDYRPPQVMDFEPTVVVASQDHRSAGLVLKGMYLATGLGMPTVTFGKVALQVGGSDDKLTVDIGPVIENPVAANSILVRYGAAGTPTVEYSVPVHTPTPSPSPTLTPTPTRTPTRTQTPIPLVASFRAAPTSGKWPLVVQVTDQSSGGIQSWNWNFGDGNGATVRQPPAHTYGRAGTYTISLTVTNASGQTQTFTSQVQVLSRVGEAVRAIGQFGGFWGDWHGLAMCPNSKLAYGFDVKVESRQGGDDDTALNGIRLTCGKDGIPVGEVTSGEGGWGSWRGGKQCPNDQYLTGARMMIERRQGDGDDTAADNVAFICTGGSELVIEHNAEFGTWSSLQMCPADTAICGIETRVEAFQHSGDDTALNDAMFFCCYSR